MRAFGIYFLEGIKDIFLGRPRGYISRRALYYICVGGHCRYISWRKLRIYDMSWRALRIYDMSWRALRIFSGYLGIVMCQTPALSRLPPLWSF